MTMIHPYLIYPAVMSLGFALHYLLQAYQSPLWIGTYLPITLAGVLIILLEHVRPKHPHWKPRLQDIRTDVGYTILIQIALPTAIKLGLVLFLLQQTNTATTSVWPHALGIEVQALLMLLIIDFMRYWLHRLAHHNRFLWSLHAVHHSPRKLYWLNTSRFHPLEKSIQMLFDTIPFLVLGVSTDVFALYFIFYAINGFFQHANISYRLGYLNLFISAGELHRWHHSRNEQESGKNLGSSLIIWDVLFGTWFLPANREVDQLGLHNPDYPQTLGKQLFAPFIRGLYHHNPAPLDGSQPTSRIVSYCCAALCYCHRLSRRQAFTHIQHTQQTTLSRILRGQARTAVGKSLKLSDKDSVRDFQYKCAIGVADQIFSREQADYHALVKKPAVYLAKTSGTTGNPKLLPKSSRDIRSIKNQQRLSNAMLLARFPEAFAGKIIHITGQAIEGRDHHGLPYGSISGLFAENTSLLFRNKLLLDATILSIPNTLVRDLLILRLILQHPDITMISVANPATLLRLQHLLEAYRKPLLASLRSGDLCPVLDPALIPEQLLHRFHARTDRAAMLEQIGVQMFNLGTCLPALKLVNTWTNGSCAFALGEVRNVLPPDCEVVDLGLIASEARLTTIDPCLDSQYGIPMIRDCFYEFIQRGDYENGVRRTLLLHELRPLEEYYLIVTTSSGLFRYFMNDIVDVKWRDGIPLLRFLRKGRDMTSLAGEKLHQNQVSLALQGAISTFDVKCGFFLALAVDKPAHYRLLLESNIPDQGRAALAEYLDQQLSLLNCEYASKRKSGRLKPLTVEFLKPHTSQAYRLFCTHVLKQRDAQFKPAFLHYNRTFEFPVADHIIPEKQQ